MKYSADDFCCSLMCVCVCVCVCVFVCLCLAPGAVSSSNVRLPGDQINEHKQRAVHSGLLKLAKEASGAQGMFKLDSEDWVNRFTTMLFKESSSVS